MVRTPAFTAGGWGSIPGQGTEILEAAWHSQKKKKVVLERSYHTFSSVILVELL